MKSSAIRFLRKKDYKFIKEIGQGGTGKTILLKDEIIDEKFICKKYSPYCSEYQKLFFDNFKDEIKLLHLANHKNIVRVFNYYLYPENHTGYLLMEFIDGKNISTYLRDNPDKLDDVFLQTINGFLHLEQMDILHRDIRPDNILVSDEGIVKIIDFGFGKKIDFESDFNKRISLNWRYSPPNDFNEEKYDFKTEMYFLGKLFEEIIIENNFNNFRYKEILKNMVKIDYNDRIQSFFELYREIISESTYDVIFSDKEKEIYRNFADGFEKILSEIDNNTEYITEVPKIMRNMKEIYKSSILEENIQNPNKLIKCFIEGSFKYYPSAEVKVDDLNIFLNFISSASKEKQKIILNNLWQRLDKFKRISSNLSDDLPF